MRRVAALALGLAFLGAGCGNKEAGTTATRGETEAAPANAPTGFTVRLVKDQGFSIALPKDWKSLDARDALNSEAMQQFWKANPAASLQIQALSQPNSPIKLLAVGPADRGGFATNLNVLVTKVPSGLSYEDWSSAEIAELKKAPTIKGLTQEETSLPPGPALHVTYRATFNSARAGGRFTALIDQYLVKEGSALYVVTFTTTPRLQAKLEPIFEQASRTFRLSG